MIERPIVIPPEDRGLAMVAHLAGLSGYILPLGGVLVPIAIWIAKRDSPYISRIAQQAVLLNVAVFVTAPGIVLFMLATATAGPGADTGSPPLEALVGAAFLATIVVVMGAAVVLPIVGAVKASRGEYYRYPVVGLLPS